MLIEVLDSDKTLNIEYVETDRHGVAAESGNEVPSVPVHLLLIFLRVISVTRSLMACVHLVRVPPPCSTVRSCHFDVFLSL